MFDSCIIYAKTRTRSGNSFITAANTPAGQEYGYVFRDCKLPANFGSTSYFLGRPWQNSTGMGTIPASHTKVVFINTTMSNSIRSEGWTKWDTATITSLVYYAEYKSKYFNGTLVDTSKRVNWSYQLTDAEAASYTIPALFRDWDPNTTFEVRSRHVPEIVVSNFKVKKDSTGLTFNWNISWPIDKVRFELYRSAEIKGKYKRISTVKATNDTTVNFESKEKRSKTGIDYYYLKASMKGHASHFTDTLEVFAPKL